MPCFQGCATARPQPITTVLPGAPAGFNNPLASLSLQSPSTSSLGGDFNAAYSPATIGTAGGFGAGASGAAPPSAPGLRGLGNMPYSQLNALAAGSGAQQPFPGASDEVMPDGDDAGADAVALPPGASLAAADASPGAAASGTATRPEEDEFAQVLGAGTARLGCRRCWRTLLRQDVHR